jgi:hypothetical protein
MALTYDSVVNRSPLNRPEATGWPARFRATERAIRRLEGQSDLPVSRAGNPSPCLFPAIVRELDTKYLLSVEIRL